MVRYFLYALLLSAVRLIPQRFQYWVAIQTADLDYMLLHRRRAAAIRDNQRRADPDGSAARHDYHARWALRNFAKYLTEFFRFRRMDARYFARRVRLLGRERLECARAGGRGAVVVSMHLSNWELAGAYLARGLGYPVNAVAAAHRLPRINGLFVRERAALGVKVVGADAGGARRALAALRANEFVCLLGDRDPTGGGVTVDFFGRPCRFPQGPARLALRAGAPLLPGFCRRKNNDAFHLEVLAPIAPPASGGTDEKVRAMTQAFARLCEEAVRRQPEEWAAFYPLWDDEWTPR